MIKFSKEKIKLLHQIMAEATGGSVGVRDEALLESALESCFATFDELNYILPKKRKPQGLVFLWFQITLLLMVTKE